MDLVLGHGAVGNIHLSNTAVILIFVYLTWGDWMVIGIAEPSLAERVMLHFRSFLEYFEAWVDGMRLWIALFAPFLRLAGTFLLEWLRELTVPWHYFNGWWDHFWSR